MNNEMETEIKSAIKYRDTLNKREQKKLKRIEIMDKRIMSFDYPPVSEIPFCFIKIKEIENHD